MEFFRGPKIVVVPQINTDSWITFWQPDSIDSEEDYAQLMKEFMWCSAVEAPMFAYYIENGYLSSEDLNKMRAKRDQILKQFKDTVAYVPIAVDIKINGYRATTIESVETSIPLIGKQFTIPPQFAKINLYIEPSKVDGLTYKVKLPVEYLMHGEIIDFLTKLTAQTPDRFREAAFDVARNELDAAPFISLDSKGTVILTDQFGTQYSGTFDLRPISDLPSARMTETVPVPEYLTIAPWERGSSLNMSFEDYRSLAHTSLGIIESIPDSTMGIYRTETGCALDIWLSNQCLTIQINSEAKQLGLLLSDLDSGKPPRCILSVNTSASSWKRLGQLARNEIK